MPTERPPLVGEVSATFADGEVSCSQRGGSLSPQLLFFRPEQLLFLPSSLSIVLTNEPRSRPTTSQKI
jgi:hypothetical protein